MSHLTLEQRYTIVAMKKAGCSNKKIAETIGKHESVLSREISRNKDLRSGEYRADLAQRKTDVRKANKRHYRKLTASMQDSIAVFIGKKYSPEQIVGKCEILNEDMVSHETIYKYIWKDKEAGGFLYANLRTQGKKYKSRGQKVDKRGQIVDRRDIKTRPAEVEKRERLGDLEIDTIIGKDHKGAILTINDRATGMLWIKKLEGKDATQLALAAIEILEAYKPYIKTITSDNGKEFSAHKLIAKELKIDFYFAEPYCSWQRGSNENLNKLVRQYIPKKTDFDTISEEFIEKITREINERPRKRYNFKNPIEMFNQKIAFAA